MNFNDFKVAKSAPPPPLNLQAPSTEEEIEYFMLINGWCPTCSSPAYKSLGQLNIYQCKMQPYLHMFEVDRMQETVSRVS